MLFGYTRQLEEDIEFYRNLLHESHKRNIMILQQEFEMLDE